MLAHRDARLPQSRLSRSAREERAHFRPRSPRALVVGFIILLAVGCGSSDDSLIPVLSGSKAGFIDAKGEYKINPQFDAARPFHGGMAAVRLGDKWGFIDDEGQYTINPQFDVVGDFDDERAWFCTSGKCGFIDPTGKIAINPQFDTARKFSDGLAAVAVDGRWGFIDEDGKYVINPQFEDAGPFSEGLAAVRVSGRCGFVDRKGQLKINPQFDAVLDFSEGRAAFLSDGKVGYIDESGKIVIPAQFESGTRFRDGLATVRVGARYGAVDRDGKFKVKAQYEQAKIIGASLLPLSLGGKWGFADTDGDLKIQPQFDESSSFKDGLAPVRVGSRWGFIDDDGKVVVNPQFDAIISDSQSDPVQELRGVFTVALGTEAPVLVGINDAPPCVYTMTLSDAAAVRISLKKETPSATPALAVRGPSGQSFSADVSDGSTAVFQRVFAKGEYQVDVCGSRGIGKLTLKVENSAANNQLKIGDTRSASLENDQPAIYRLDVSDAGDVSIAVDSVGGTIDPQFVVYDRNGQIVFGDDDGGGSRNARAMRRLDAGSYFVSVSAYRGGRGGYVLRAERYDADSLLRRTLADIRSLATAIEARATDTNDYAFTDITGLVPLLSPTYIHNPPQVDAWGHPLYYAALDGGRGYAIASPGADGLWQLQNTPAATGTFGDDLLFRNGQWVVTPAGAAAAKTLQ